LSAGPFLTPFVTGLAGPAALASGAGLTGAAVALRLASYKANRGLAQAHPAQAAIFL